jgi:hypothetical protein
MNARLMIALRIDCLKARVKKDKERKEEKGKKGVLLL